MVDGINYNHCGVFLPAWMGISILAASMMVNFPRGAISVSRSITRSCMFPYRLQSNTVDCMGLLFLDRGRPRSAGFSAPKQLERLVKRSETETEALSDMVAEEKGRSATHSARIGSALHSFCCHDSPEDIALRVRWKSLNSLQYYLTNGRAWIMKLQANEHVQQKICNYVKQTDALFPVTEQPCIVGF